MTVHSVRSLLPGSRTVLAIVRVNGNCDASDFIAGLRLQSRAKFQSYFERLRDGHHVKSPENMRFLQSDRYGAKLHELKVHSDGGLRIYVVEFDNKWLATHGVKKVKDNRVPAEVAKAFGIFYEWHDYQKGLENGRVSDK